MLKQSIALGTFIAFAMLIAVAITSQASAVVTPTGMDMAAMVSDGRTLAVEAWDAF